MIYNKKNNPSDAPQDSPKGKWLVVMHTQSKDIQKQYKANKDGWAIDTSLKVTVIEW